jgi:hypothetical protein
MKETANGRPTLKARFLKLWRSNDSPHEIALGIAIGVFIGITPLYGFHMIMVFIAAITIRRVNKVAIFLGVNISVPPTIPFITWAGYSIGRIMLGSSYLPLGWEYFRHFSYSIFFHFFYALLAGSLALGIAVSTAVYFVILYLLKRRKVRAWVAQERSL